MNDFMQRARETAISFLDPTPAQMEHGLELHAASIVCDTFGFVPCSVPDVDGITRLVQSGAPRLAYQDALEEMRLTGCLRSTAARKEFREAWEASGVTGLYVSATDASHRVARQVRRMGHLTYLVDGMPDLLARASTPEDVLAAKQQGRCVLYLASNAVPLAAQWESVADELAYIRVLYQLGIRMMHLTYNRRNPIGDGCGESADGGLSEFGKAAVAEMNRTGVIVDVAHSGPRTSREAAEISSYPVVASHTTCGALNSHIRAKSDDVIRAIADSGGYVGICTIGSFLGRSRAIPALLDHVDHVATRYGVDHVAIGTDAGHVLAGHEEAMRELPPPPPGWDRWEHLWPGDSLYDPALERPRDLLSLAWTNWPLFTVGLVQRGYSDEDIRKVIGGNAVRVAEQVTGADDRGRTSEPPRPADYT